MTVDPWEEVARSRGFELYEDKAKRQFTWPGFILSTYSFMKSGHLKPSTIRTQLEIIFRDFNGGRLALTTDEWVELFAYAGYKAGKPDDSEPITLYRGCHPRFKHNMSWTDNYRIAAGYARKWNVNGIYRITVTKPEIIRSFDGRIPEREHVVDPRGRDIELVPGTLKANPGGVMAWPKSQSASRFAPSMETVIRLTRNRLDGPASI